MGGQPSEINIVKIARSVVKGRPKLPIASSQAAVPTKASAVPLAGTSAAAGASDATAGNLEADVDLHLDLEVVTLKSVSENDDESCVSHLSADKLPGSETPTQRVTPQLNHVGCSNKQIIEFCFLVSCSFFGFASSRQYLWPTVNGRWLVQLNVNRARLTFCLFQRFFV